MNSRTVRHFIASILPALAFLFAWTVDARPASAQDLGFQVQSIFQTHCSQCHGPGSPGFAGLSQITDLQFLVTAPQGFIVPNSPEGSRIYQEIISDRMPFNQTPLSESEKSTVRDWILAGAPSATGPHPHRLEAAAANRLIIADLQSVSAEDRAFQRYFSYVHLNNGGASEREKEIYRQALSKLLNSLSQSQTIHQPKVVTDSGDGLYRIDLRHYEWSFETWNKLEETYPFARLLEGFGEIQRLTNSTLPVIQGDWFCKTASLEPLYGKILGHPNSSRMLERKLGFVSENNVRTGAARRAGFAESGVALHNRIIERHEIQSYPGAFWLSYDFVSSFAEKDIRKNPLGPIGVSLSRSFEHDGGEIIYQLPNGLHAYMLVNNRKEVLREAPIAIVRDDDPRRPVILNGVSCMSCHSSGLNDKNFDIVADNARLAADPELETIVALYASKSELEGLYKKDNDTFRTALALAGVEILPDKKEQVNFVAFNFDAPVRLELAAETLGISPEALETIFTANPRLNPIASQLRGAGMPRENFIADFQELVTAVNNDPINSPFTLQSAIDQSQPHEVISIPDGDYKGNLLIRHPLTLEAAPGAKVLIRGQVSISYDDPSTHSYSPVLFRNLGFEFSDSSEKNGIIEISAGSVRIENSNFSSDFPTNRYALTFAILARKAQFVAVDDSTFSHLRGGIETNGGSVRILNSQFRDSAKGIFAKNADDLQLQASVITNVQEGIVVDGGRMIARNLRMESPKTALKFSGSIIEVLESNIQGGIECEACELHLKAVEQSRASDSGIKVTGYSIVDIAISQFSNNADYGLLLARETRGELKSVKSSGNGKSDLCYEGIDLVRSESSFERTGCN